MDGMSLKEQLNSFVEQSNKKISPETEMLFKQAIDVLEKNAEIKGIKIGERAPDVVLINPAGNSVTLPQLMKDGPLVLILQRLMVPLLQYPDECV